MEPYEHIAPFYDWEHAGFSDDVDFYLNMVKSGPVLEVGVGTGRIMGPLLDAGLEVCGVDTSGAMLRLARSRLHGKRRAELVQASMTSMELRRVFKTILLPLNTLCHVRDSDELVSALKTVRSHCASEAVLLIDLSNPLTLADRGANGDMRQRFSGSRGRQRLLVSSAAWDDEVDQMLTLSLVYDVCDAAGRLERHTSELRFRYIFRSELQLLLRLSGFTVEAEYGSYDLEPYSAAAPNLIVVARAT